jgi:hypothetical protein
MKKQLSQEQSSELLATLKARFGKNTSRHSNINWTDVQVKLEANPEKLWVLDEMEQTGGEPDIVAFDDTKDIYTFFDCAAESPKGRRSICYDKEALDSRKEYKPADSAINMAAEMGVEILTEEEYHHLQKLGSFDLKTSSWIITPANIRKLGGAIFCDRRYDTVFTYHNGAESYYAARGFRSKLKI